MTNNVTQYLEPLMTLFFDTGDSAPLIDGIRDIIATSLDDNEKTELEYIIAELIFQKVDLPLTYYLYAPSLLRMNHYDLEFLYLILIKTPINDIPSGFFKFEYFDFYLHNGLFDTNSHVLLKQSFCATIDNVQNALWYVTQYGSRMSHQNISDFQTEIYNPHLDLVSLLSSKTYHTDYTHLMTSLTKCEAFGNAVLQTCEHLHYSNQHYSWNSNVIMQSSILDLIYTIKRIYQAHPEAHFFTKLWTHHTRLAHEIAHYLLINNPDYRVFIELVQDNNVMDVDYYGLYLTHNAHSVAETILLL